MHAFKVRPIEKKNGKIQLEEFVVFCDEKFQTVANCKKYVDAYVCIYRDHLCTENLLNNIPANCTMIRERMLQLEEVDEGKIVVSGINTINNVTKEGVHLILFNGTIVVNGRNYTNDKELMAQYLRKNKPTQYEILEIIESQNEKLKIPILNVLERIPIQIESHPVKSAIILLVLIIFSVIVMNCLMKLCKIYNAYKSRKESEQTNLYIKALFDAKLGTISFNKCVDSHE